jgi:hypothetical protein
MMLFDDKFKYFSFGKKLSVKLVILLYEKFNDDSNGRGFPTK